MNHTDVVPVFATPSPEVRRIAVDRPWHWMQMGFADMVAGWRVSLAYGAVVVAFSWGLVLAMTGAGYFYLLLPMCAGFMLVAPLAAVGLYEASRRRARGEEATFRDTLGAFRANGLQIGLMGVLLLLLQLFWIRTATLLFALFFSGLNPSFENLVSVVFNSAVSLPFLVVGTALGGVLAFAAFCLSAVSLPMLLDRQTNIFTAVATSITAVQVNPKAMLLWGFIIVFFTGVGLATLFFGLAFAFPLIGHATWHAYKDLVAEDGETV